MNVLWNKETEIAWTIKPSTPCIDASSYHVTHALQLQVRKAI